MNFDDAKPKSGGGESKRLEDLFDMLPLKDGKWTQIRLMPYEGTSVGQHWIDIIGSKSKKEVRIPKMCVSYDGKTEEHDPKVKCPYCSIDEKFNPFYLFNVLVRGMQEDAPRKNKLTSAEKKSGIKDVDSDSWTPIRVLRIPSSLMRKIMGLKDLNKDRKTKKTYSVASAEFGADINVMYNSKASGTDKYQVQLSDKVALTEEELAFLRYELDGEEIAKELGRETPKAAAAEFKRMEIADASKFDDSDDDSDDSDDADMGSKKKKSSSSKSSRSSKKDESDDDSEDSDDGDSSDDKSAKKRSSKRAASSDDDSDDGDSSDDNSDNSGDSDSDSDDGDSSDDKPAKKSSRSSNKNAASSDDESDDESSDEKPAAKKRSSKRAASSDDDSDDGDSSDDKPAPKKSSRSSSKKVASSDDDSDDKPAKKSSRSSSKKKADDSSDDIPF